MPRSREFQIRDGLKVTVRLTDEDLVAVSGLTQRKMSLLRVLFEELCGEDPVDMSDRQVSERVVALVHRREQNVLC